MDRSDNKNAVTYVSNKELSVDFKVLVKNMFEVDVILSIFCNFIQRNISLSFNMKFKTYCYIFYLIAALNDFK